MILSNPEILLPQAVDRSPRIHPKALVESERIGDGTRIWAFAHVSEGVEVGEDCNICDHTFLEAGVTLGNRVTVKCGVHLWDGIHLEDDVFVGPNVSFTNDLYPRSRAYLPIHPKTIVRRGASIGAGAILLPGIEIGAYALIGAGAVVTKPVPAFALVYGNPATVQGRVDRAGRPVGSHPQILPFERRVA